MNLLFLDSIATDIYGGLESWIGMVSAGLVERGHKVLAVGRPGSEYLRRTSLVSSQVATAELTISGDFNPVTIAAVKRIFDRHAIDAVICNFNKDVRLGGLAARWRGRTKVIWRLGNNLVGRGLAHRYLTPRLLDGAITPSHELKRQITEPGFFDPDLVRVIHTGIKEPHDWHSGPRARHALRDKYHLSEDSLIAVTSGRFVSQKGHQYLVEAAVEIVAGHPGVRFLWLGDGPLERDLRAQIDRAGLTDRFIFAGLLDKFELELAGADLMIHPATIEPFGIVLLEGMRAGLPIVASRVGGIPEVVSEGETGLLVPPADTEALQVAVLNLLDNAELMSDMGRAGLERWMTEFSYDTMMENVEGYLRSVVNGRPEAVC